MARSGQKPIVGCVVVGAGHWPLRQTNLITLSGAKEGKQPSGRQPLTPQEIDSRRKWRRQIFFATVTFFAGILGEMQLEAATQCFAKLDATTTALVATCGEFAGCCFFGFLTGGKFLVAAEREGLQQIASVPSDGVIGKLVTYIRGYTPFGLTAFLICLGTGLANMAVAYVQYPVKVIFKSSKLIPSMAVSVAFGNSSRFTLQEYFAGLALCLGTASFTSSGAGRTDTSFGLVVLGVCMLLIGILSECFVSNLQEWMLRQQLVTPMTLMLRQNFLSLVVCSGLLFLPTDEPLGFILKLIMDPYAMRLFLVTGLCTGISVWANMHLINEAGTVRKEELSLVRKVVTVMMSYMLFPKAFSWRQGVGLTLITGGLWLHNASKQRSSSRRGPN